MKEKGFATLLILIIVLLVTISVSITVVYYYQNKEKKNLNPLNENQTENLFTNLPDKKQIEETSRDKVEILPEVDQESEAEVVIEEEIYRIYDTQTKFHARELLAEYYDDTEDIKFYKVGDVISGVFKGSKIISASYYSTAGPCKGSGCGSEIVVRGLLNGNDFTVLRKLGSTFRFVDSMEVNNWNFTDDNTIVIDSLERKDLEVSLSDKWSYLNSGTPNDKVFELFKDKDGNSIYTTKPKYSLSEPFYVDEEKIGSWNGRRTGEYNGVQGCIEEECLLYNGYYRFYPDGTFDTYAATINSDLKLNVAGEEYNLDPWTGDYFTTSRNGCNQNNANYLLVLDPSVVSKDDLKVVGNISDSDREIFYFKDSKHPYFDHFFQKYKTYYKEFSEYMFDDDYEVAENLNEFYESYPIVFFDDDFGRLIGATKKGFVPSFACEPIIYLYPEEKTHISLSVDKNTVKLLHTEPRHGQGWEVLAFPGGKILDIGTNIEHNYLFWEGVSNYVPIRKDGFVLKSNEVYKELPLILVKLGLNSSEVGDFMEAWLHKLVVSNYVYITFHATDEVNKYAPLEIDPKPNTVIRILMEYKPLDYPINVEDYVFPNVPNREGFTLIEWGGLEK